MGNPCHSPHSDPWELVDEAGADLRAIVIAVGYRLNIFGFLAGQGIDGNFGFWDQRCALEWVRDHISAFGGDPHQITLGGLSAGALSAHYQLQYELLHGSGSMPLFRNIFMCSNAISVRERQNIMLWTSLTILNLRCNLNQFKNVKFWRLRRFGVKANNIAANLQLEDVFDLFNIDPLLSVQEKIDRLRNVPSNNLIAKFSSLRLDTFRPVTDGDFVAGDMLKLLRDGTVARLFKDRGMRIMIGETESENYYPEAICRKLLASYGMCREQEVGQTYGLITSDVQVRAPIRAFVKTLADVGVPLHNIFRYRSQFRAKCISKLYSPELGVTHSVDMCVWWYLVRFGYEQNETVAARDWLSRSLIPLVNGAPLRSECSTIKQYMEFTPNAEIRAVDDVYWDRMITLSEICAETV
ncbi:unnamed protein product [Clonostachys solani]|uniref:Carboxylic ester hydrolase n=1 Tax=Clonostachys solani TaxID=160281 RepID=A0A9N9ZF37_9HYPO|nr:unnamed protein product [Clonostachys solani]